MKCINAGCVCNLKSECNSPFRDCGVCFGHIPVQTTEEIKKYEKFWKEYWAQK